MRAAAAEKRFATNKVKGNTGKAAYVKYINKKDKSALEQQAMENLGYRHMDENAEMRAWN
jgi:hypothetical protein